MGVNYIREVNTILAYTKNHGLSQAQINVWKTIAFHMNDQRRECWPREDTIGRECGICQRGTVIGAVKKLNSLGLITIKKEKRMSVGFPHNVYSRGPMWVYLIPRCEELLRLESSDQPREKERSKPLIDYLKAVEELRSNNVDTTLHNVDLRNNVLKNTTEYVGENHTEYVGENHTEYAVENHTLTEPSTEPLKEPLKDSIFAPLAGGPCSEDTNTHKGRGNSRADYREILQVLTCSEKELKRKFPNIYEMLPEEALEGFVKRAFGYFRASFNGFISKNWREDLKQEFDKALNDFAKSCGKIDAFADLHDPDNPQGEPIGSFFEACQTTNKLGISAQAG